MVAVPSANRTLAALLLLAGVAVMPEVCVAQGSAECRDASCAGGTAGGSAPTPEGFPGSSFRLGASDGPQVPDETALALPQVWQAATQLFDLKLAFVTGLQRFTRAQVGTFGDEGGELMAALVAMRTALTQWDAAAKQFDESTARLRPSADLHLARASVLLLRHRPDDAVRELTKAARLDGNRTDIPALLALAQGAAGRPAEAARAAKQASSRDATNPVLAYVLAQRAAEAGQADEAQRARAKVAQLLASVSAGSGQAVTDGASPAVSVADGASPVTSGAGRALFERYGLLRQAGGVAPIFPLAIYAEGYAQLVAGDFAGGLASLEKAATSDPLVRRHDSDAGLVLRAATLLRGGQAADARESIEAAFRDGSVTGRAAAGVRVGQTEPQPAAAEACRLLALARWADSDYEVTAVHDAYDAVYLDPRSERARLRLADVLHAAERVEEERYVLEGTARALPRSGAAHFRLGQLHEAAGRLDAARASYLAAIEHAPVVGQDHLFFTLGNLAMKQANFDGAVEAYTRRIAVNPNSADAHRQLGEVYFLQGKDEDALAEHSVAAFLLPRDGRAHAARGQVLLRLKRYDAASSAFATAVDAGEGSMETRYGFGMALLRSGRADESRVHIAVSDRMRSEAIERGQRGFRITALIRAIDQAIKANRNEDLPGLYEEAVALTPEDPELRRDLGVVLMLVGRKSEAIAHFTIAQRERPTAVGATNLAEAYEEVGQTAGAEAARVQAERLIEQARRAKVAAWAGEAPAPAASQAR